MKVKIKCTETITTYYVLDVRNAESANEMIGYLNDGSVEIDAVGEFDGQNDDSRSQDDWQYIEELPDDYVAGQ